MKFSHLHDWTLERSAAVELQRRLAKQLVLQDQLPKRLMTVAGVDVSCRLRSRLFHAAVVLLSYPQLQLLETVTASLEVAFPYIPGLLSFREIPPLLEAHGMLARMPEVFLCDGQGIAHPRKFGLASHLGLCLEIPTVGCAKSRLCGEHEPFELERGNYTPLSLDGDTVGYVFCSRSGVKPIYISPGHRADLESSRKLVEHCLGRFRIPEPLRQAHQTATRIRKSLFAP